MLHPKTRKVSKTEVFKLEKLTKIRKFFQIIKRSLRGAENALKMLIYLYYIVANYAQAEEITVSVLYSVNRAVIRI